MSSTIPLRSESETALLLRALLHRPLRSGLALLWSRLMLLRRCLVLRRSSLPLLRSGRLTLLLRRRSNLMLLLQR